ncbi:hypothetical protein CVT25_000878 [Psilocybe cyanescens]|uniref:Uncharacterized protein n=1 Tax=Psilocybe cyanescens TaxID=93625 RepID=A0A409XEU5_PSICY|nr:hypothetical protein CVT25_000878 [Psilocybe cyanescens]
MVLRSFSIFSPLRFRIVVIGKGSDVPIENRVALESLPSSNISSTLLQRRILFNCAYRTSYSDDRAGKADITYSLGFELGIVENWKIVEKFLRERNVASLPLQDRVYAIWYLLKLTDTIDLARAGRLCLETPRTGSRLQETSDENLLKLANTFTTTIYYMRLINRAVNIPAISVFTKQDILVNERFQKAQEVSTPPACQIDLVQLLIGSEIDRISEEIAEGYFDERIKDFRASTQVPCVRVSTDDDYPGSWMTSQGNVCILLKETSGSCGRQLSKSAQIRKFSDPLAKFGRLIVDHCIDQRRLQERVFTSLGGFLERADFFWMDLGMSTAFQGRVLIDCVARIHKDILKIWNFNGPLNIVGKVSTAHFPSDDFGSSDDRLSHYSAIMPLWVPRFAQFMGAAGISVVAIKYLYGKYQITYHTLHMDPSRLLLVVLISGEVVNYNAFISRLFTSVFIR